MKIILTLIILSIIVSVLNFHVGTQPLALTSNHYLFVANFGSNTVSVINPENFSIIKNISVGKGPSSLLYVNQFLYVASTLSSQINIIDVNSLDIVRNISVSYPYSITYDPQNGEFFVSISAFNELAIIKNYTVVNIIKIPQGVGSLAYDPKDSLIYISGIYNNSVIVFDPINDSIIRVIHIYRTPVNLVYSGGNIFVTDPHSNFMTVINTKIENVSVGEGIFSVAYNKSDGLIYATNIYNNSILIFKNGNYIDSIPVGIKPTSVILYNGKIITTDYGNNEISVITTKVKSSLNPIYILIIIAVVIVVLASIYGIKRR
ncbi:YncE family protein [Acidianus brierleyi]|uniref:YNCE-like beta-propeller domain-containing protein n=1 Tax=Acidianus brierleyi TaxID=41673 RepID=A0A2U9IHH7_9CREN|nr:hypothetical protein [Acidianus brierleyi]AWR95470.1 hypothetical protein DFR85_13580 [Acidianus brierleyi]